MLPLTHSSPRPKWHLDRFSRFCADHSKVPILYNGPPLFPQNCPFVSGDINPHLIGLHGALGPPEFTAQRISQSVQPFYKAHDRDRQTDRNRQTTLLLSVTIGRVYVVLQCGLITTLSLAKKKRVTGYSSSQHASPLLELTCHIWDHTVLPATRQR